MNIYKFTGDGTEAGVSCIILANDENHLKVILEQHLIDVDFNYKGLWKECDNFEQYFSDGDIELLCEDVSSYKEGATIDFCDKCWD